MPISSGWRLRGALLLLGALLVPVAGQAQVDEADLRAQADHLHALAMTAAEFINHQDDAGLIARMHGEAAKLRDRWDPRAFHCWRLQASLLDAAGEPEEALVYLEDAAEVAMEQGVPAWAAHAMLDAAGLLQELGRRNEAQILIQRAHRLSLGGGMTSAQQREIQERIRVR